jgi:hypothetical protein
VADTMAELRTGLLNPLIPAKAGIQHL